MKIATTPQSRPGWSAQVFRRASTRKNLEGWLFASPWIIGFLLWTLGPMIASFVLAFTEWDLLTPARFVGLGNVETMLADPLLAQALKVTTIYALVSVPLHILCGVLLALLLNNPIHGMRWYRTAIYMPSVLSGVAVALIWKWFYSPQFGMINLALSSVNIQGPAWFADEAWALPSLVIMSLWSIGNGVIIYLAGLQGIPTDVYEAAEVDGASWWDRLRSITLPLLTPVLFFQLVTGIIAALQVFTQPFILTAGGPHNATLFVLLYLYQNAFQWFKMGYASAIAWVIFLYILVLTLLVFRFSAFWVYYEGETRKEQ